MKLDPASLLGQCWAKSLENGRPGISALEHCRNVGLVAQVLIKLLPEAVQRLLPDGVATVAALHDAGKVSPGFQQQCPEWRNRNSPWFRPNPGYEQNHALISQWFLEWFTQGRLRRAAEAVGAHHGLVQGPVGPAHIGDDLWNQARVELARAMERDFGPLPNQDLPNDASEWVLAGLIAVADWLASDETRFSQESQQALSIEERKAQASRTVSELLLGGGHVLDDQAFSQVFEDRLGGKRE
jgi:CRISPR-associated endonuclease/helicase Cas3